MQFYIIVKFVIFNNVTKSESVTHIIFYDPLFAYLKHVDE